MRSATSVTVWTVAALTLTTGVAISQNRGLSVLPLVVALGAVALTTAPPLTVVLITALAWNLINIELVKVLGLLPNWTYYASDACVFAAIGLALALQGRHPATRRSWVRPMWGVLGLLIASGITAGLLQASSLTTSLLGLRWLAYPILGLAVAGLSHSFRRKLFRQVVIFLVIGCLVSQLPVSAYQLLTRQHLPAPEFTGSAGKVFGVGIRAYGLMGWPTTLALLLLVPSLAVGLRVIGGMADRKTIVAAVFLVTLIVLTFSRGSLLALAAGLVSGSVAIRRLSVRRSAHPRRTAKVLAVTGVLVVAGLGLGLSGLASRSADFNFTNYHRDVAHGGRLALIRVSLELMHSSPVVGLGPGRFGGGVARARSGGVTTPDGEQVLTAESSLLQLGVEEGLVGLVGFAALLLLGTGRLLSPRDEGWDTETVWEVGTALAAMVAFAVSTLDAPSLEIRQVALPVWLLVGLACPAPRSGRAVTEPSPEAVEVPI